jgi:phytoene dehydrogenase-like protein
MFTDYDVVIIGSGCAGLAAAIYTSRAGYETVIMEKETMGGGKPGNLYDTYVFIMGVYYCTA